ncbi:MAG: hypothetical protein HYV63_17895 [Candidatus Schekmanbacteria bacterium]|nr:hypothetical protein [Candidatus Schekmanbacteria bacterium]
MKRSGFWLLRAMLLATVIGGVACPAPDEDVVPPPTPTATAAAETK